VRRFGVRSLAVTCRNWPPSGSHQRRPLAGYCAGAGLRPAHGVYRLRYCRRPRPAELARA